MKNDELSNIKERLGQMEKSKRLIELLWSLAETPLNPDYIRTAEIKKKAEMFKQLVIDYIDQLCVPMDQFIEAVKQIPDPDQQMILRNRYDLMRSWEDIAFELNFSTQWIYELHRRGLVALQAIYERSDPA